MSRQSVLDKLRNAVPLIAPSMLKCDFGNLEREIRRLEAAGAQTLHLDVMDGHFVPNLSYGPMVIRRMRPLTELTFDAHLMISTVERDLDEYLQAGCDCVTVHVEAVPEPQPVLAQIREAGAVAGIALNPGTPLEAVEPVLAECDQVLVMSVEPGFGGQDFMPSVLEKVQRLKQLSQPRGPLVSIDGGIGPSTIGDASRAGADVFVTGSAIFEAADYQTAIEEMRQTAAREAATAVTNPD